MADVELEWSREGVVSLPDGDVADAFQMGTYVVRATLPGGATRLRVLPRGIAVRRPDLPDDIDYCADLADDMLQQTEPVVVEDEEIDEAERAVDELRPAPKGYPIKLVRDRTPEIINQSGEPGALFYDSIPESERPAWLRRKLMEEVGEYLESRGVDELTDVLAVVEALAATHGEALYELAQRALRDQRGGFFTGRMMRGYHPEFDGR